MVGGAWRGEKEEREGGREEVREESERRQNEEYTHTLNFSHAIPHSLTEGGAGGKPTDGMTPARASFAFPPPCLASATHDAPTQHPLHSLTVPSADADDDDALVGSLGGKGKKLDKASSQSERRSSMVLSPVMMRRRGSMPDAPRAGGTAILLGPVLPLRSAPRACLWSVGVVVFVVCRLVCCRVGVVFVGI